MAFKKMYIDQWSKVPITLMKSWIQIRSKVKSWTRISIKVIRIRNLDFKLQRVLPESLFDKIFTLRLGWPQ
jgi:hypothetical protein